MVGVAWGIFVWVARKRRYEAYYKNYDAEKEFQAMVKLGVFRSINAKGEQIPNPYDPYPYDCGDVQLQASQPRSIPKKDLEPKN